jgi:hypothetical protein
MSEESAHRRPIRVAIVGTGAIARGSHLPALTALAVEQPLQIVAAVDVNAGSVEAFYADAGIGHPYTDRDLMLAEQRPDLVTLCTPPQFHRDQTIAALRAGAWVWCEKPPCPSLEGFDAIEAAEGDPGSGGPYAAIVFQHRFVRPRSPTAGTRNCASAVRPRTAGRTRATPGCSGAARAPSGTAGSSPRKAWARN